MAAAQRFSLSLNAFQFAVLLPPPKEVMFSLRPVCLSVCLSVRRITEKVVNAF